MTMPAYVVIHPRDQKREDIYVADPHLELTFTDGWAIFRDPHGICLAIPAGLGTQIQRVDEPQDPEHEEPAPQKE
ncbi:hypothetical protein ACFTXJ_14295 [Streptomyces zhihengii]|uniref:hypothetical protein n=1 Tax=Streptomyces zhihengii TaxID=1818004 RepID=UPI00363E62EF